MALTQTPEEGLKVSNAPSDGKFLQYKDSSDKLTWADVSQPGGATGIDFNDVTKIQLGTGDDAYIYYRETTGGEVGDPNNTLVIRAPDKDIQLRGDDIVLVDDASGGRAVYLDGGNSRLELGWAGAHDAHFKGDGVEFLHDVQINAQKDLRFADSDSSNYVALQAPATVSSNYTLSLPAADGSSGQAIVTDGSGNLSFSAAGASLTGSTNNTVVTVTGANAMQGEANLVFDGTHLGLGTSSAAVVSGGPGLVVHGTTAPRIRLTNATTGEAGTDGSELSIDGTTKDFWIENREDAEVRFATNGAERFVLENDGDVTIKDGDLVIGTSGHGIDFSATSDGSGTDSSELFADYEEGSWTPAMDGLSNTPTYHNLVGKYVKIGSIVKCQGFIQINASPTFTNTAHVFKVSGLPYTAGGSGYLRVIGNVAWQGIDWVGASQSTYGHADDTIIQAAIDDGGTKTTFRTMGQADYYMGELKNIVFHDNGWILEWDFSYMTI